MRNLMVMSLWSLLIVPVFAGTYGEFEQSKCDEINQLDGKAKNLSKSRSQEVADETRSDGKKSASVYGQADHSYARLGNQVTYCSGRKPASGKQGQVTVNKGRATLSQ